MEAMDEGGYPGSGETPNDWRPITELPTEPGTRVLALMEVELEMEEHNPALLMGGWRRVGERDRIVRWKPVS